MLMLLAQAPAPSDRPSAPPRTGDVMVWVGVLILAAMVGGVIWVWLRRQLLTPDSGAGPGTIMEDLRKMRDEGRISQEEYDNIRRNMATRLAKEGFGDERTRPGSKAHQNGR